MIDYNIAKFEIPVHIKKAYDKGKIDEVYKGIYAVADQLAAAETRRFMATKPSEYLEERIQTAEGAKPKKTSWSTRVMKQISKYREQRTEYHLENMLKLLELYAQSKSDSSK